MRPSDRQGAPGDSDYLRARAEEELSAAARSSCMVRSVHLELAELYTEKAQAQLAGETAPDGRAEPASL